MIKRIWEVPVTDDSYVFASAERYLHLSEQGFVEREYFFEGTANVYETVDELGNVAVRTPDAPYVNRIVVRAPADPARSSGNVVVEIINPTSLMEIDRMWIHGYREFVRNGDVYVGITSKHATLGKLREFDPKRYAPLSWANPTPEVPLPYTDDDMRAAQGLVDRDPACEPGLFWDMLTDLAWLLRGDDEKNPIADYAHDKIYLTGWSQSGSYLYRYLDSFSERPEVKRDGCVFDGYLAGGPAGWTISANQYEWGRDIWAAQYPRFARQPLMVVQTESENAKLGNDRHWLDDADRPDFHYRKWEITGASHDTQMSYTLYYQNDPDLVRIDHLPFYMGKNEEGNNYPSWVAFCAAYHALFRWVRDGAAPASMESKIPVGVGGENLTDAFGNTRGGLRTCLVDYPTGRYCSTSDIERGQYFLDPEATKEGLFGYQESFSAELLQELYGSLEHYRELCRAHTAEQVSKGFVCAADADELVEFAVALAARRGLE